MTGRFWPIDDRLRHWHPVVLAGRVSVTPQTASVSFTPPCASYGIHWTAGPGGSTRAFGMRFVNYYSEVDAERTSLFSFVYRKIAGTWMRAIPHLARPLFCRLVSAELDRDKAIIEKMPRDQASLDWFQLSRFDGPLVATRKLMARHYAPSRDSAPIGCDLEPATIPPAITSDARL